jgi:ABC-2 type transport system permease protein
VGATAAGLARQEGRREQAARYQAIVERQWQEQPDRHPHRVAHYGFLVFRHPPPLGFADLGTAGFTGVSLFLEAHRQNLPSSAEASLSPGAGRFGELTITNVLQLFVPLVVVILSAVSITRDRENGTLPLTLGLGVSFGTIAAGKCLGLLFALAVIVGPGLLLSTAVLTFTPDAVEPGHGRLAAWLLATAAHVTVVAALGTVASVRMRSSRDALLVGLSAWVALWIVLPRALPVVAARLWPLPSRSAFEANVEREVRSLGDSHNPNDPSFLAFRTALLRQHGVASVEELPQNFNGLVMAEGERHTAEAYRAHVETVHGILDRHQAVLSLGGIASPFLALRGLSMAVAGADVAHMREFERQAEAHRFDLIQRLNALHAERVEHAKDRYSGGAEGAAPSRHRIDRAHFLELPRFAYQAPGLRWSLLRQRAAVALNLAWLVGSLVLLRSATARARPGGAA